MSDISTIYLVWNFVLLNRETEVRPEFKRGLDREDGWFPVYWGRPMESSHLEPRTGKFDLQEGVVECNWMCLYVCLNSEMKKLSIQKIYDLR